ANYREIGTFARGLPSVVRRVKKLSSLQLLLTKEHTAIDPRKFALKPLTSNILIAIPQSLRPQHADTVFPGSRIMNTTISPRLVRRISAAEGYLDLDMPERAMRELEAISDPGPYEPTVEYMKGEALIAQRRFAEAIAPLKRAVQLIPPPHNREAWKSLGECY